MKVPSIRSLRIRLPLLSFAAFLVVATAFILVVSGAVLEGNRGVERDDASQQSTRVQNALTARAAFLGAMARDWAEWDDAYSFALGSDRGFLEQNVNPATFTNLHIDFIAVYNTANELVGAVQVVDGELGPLRSDLADTLSRYDSLRSEGAITESSGLLAVGPSVVLLGDGAILPSGGAGDSAGRMIFGRYLRADEADEIGRQLVSTVKFGSPVPGEPSAIPSEYPRPTTPGVPAIAFFPDDRVIGVTTLLGLDGRPAVNVSVDQESHSAGFAEQTLAVLDISIVAFVVAFALGVGIVMEFGILRRIDRLHDWIEQLTDGRPEGDALDTVAGRDELTDLAIALDDAVGRQQEAEEALRQAADHDYLTDLANRRRLAEDAQRELAESAREGDSVALILLDVDKFKQINDVHGHQCGDEVLVWVSEVLRSSVRSYSTIARTGGDEFAILLPHTDVQGTEAVLERLRESFSSSVPECLADAPEHWAGVSLGAAVSPLDGLTLEALAAEADRRLYTDKTFKSGFFDDVF